MHYFKINLWNIERNSCRNKVCMGTPNMVYMKQRHYIAILTSWYLRKVMRKFTSVIFYMNITCIAQWLLEANFEILHFFRCVTWRHKHCNENGFFLANTCRLFFTANIWRHFSITSKPRLGPFMYDADQIVCPSPTHTFCEILIKYYY